MTLSGKILSKTAQSLTRKELMPALAIWFVCSTLFVVGTFEYPERILLDSRFSFLHREVSDSLIIVEIDAVSLQEIEGWPWPRSYHAAVLDKLVAAGADTVAFDIDFSGVSKDPQSDQIFADSIKAAAGKVILPVFSQNLSTPTFDGQLKLTNAPLPILSEHALLGNVNVKAEKNGYIREASLRIDLGDGMRPSLAALLVGTARYGFEDFIIDYAISPNSIKKIRYSDVFNGNINPDEIDGKKVIVGGTAIGLGDFLTVPVHGVLPGATVQALIYESLVQGRAITRTDPVLTLTLALILALALSVLTFGRGVKSIVVYNDIAAIVILGVPVLAQFYWPISVDTVPILAVLIISSIYEFVTEHKKQGLMLFRQRVSGSYRRALMDRIVEHSFDGLILTDENGQIELCNNAACEILEREKNQLIGDQVSNYIPRTGQGSNGPEGFSFETGAHNPVSHIGPLEATLTLGSNRKTIIEFSLSYLTVDRRSKPNENSKLTQRAYVYTFRDITERRRAAEAERTAKEMAIAASRAKTEFLANMSHELRTPLNAIIGFSDIFTQQMFGPLGHENYLEYASDINHSGQQLLSVLNDILDVAKIEAGNYQVNEQLIVIDESILTAKRIAAGWPTMAGKALDFELADDLPPIMADPRLIKQMILNILSNAAKFTQEGGHITLRAFLSDSTELIVEVEDDGIGIPEDQIENLTQAFFQVDGSLARTREGTGLGLFLVNAYAKIHNGTLQIKSREGQGTVVRIILPVTVEPAVSAEPLKLESA